VFVHLQPVSSVIVGGAAGLGMHGSLDPSRTTLSSSSLLNAIARRDARYPLPPDRREAKTILLPQDQALWREYKRASGESIFFYKEAVSPNLPADDGLITIFTCERSLSGEALKCPLTESGQVCMGRAAFYLSSR
jgi:hypothetical protein